MTIAFYGLGIMGSRMAANLVRAGHELRVWTRTAEKATAFADQHRAHAAATPDEAAQGADVLITMLVDGPQVAEILGAAAGGAAPGTLAIDMSTTGPRAAREIAESLQARGLRFVDAPVTGSSPKAEDGTLTIMCGGDAADLADAQPLFEAMGSLIVHAGPVGHGQLVKVISNSVAAANAATLAQALIVASAAGADLDALVEVLGAGAAASTMVTLKARPMLEHDFTTLFKLEHMLKDVRLCLEEAQAAGAPFPAASSARDALAAGMGRGLGDADFAALLESYEGLAGRTL
jgi:3-hydroxyisobutyrate dehydrogenase-like beta-hydroxyacid dehydrogenase